MQGTREKGVEMEAWEAKQEVMRNKNRLGARSNIQRKGDQRRIRERAMEKRKKEKTVRIGYQKICIQGTWHKWNEEKDRLDREQSPVLK